MVCQLAGCKSNSDVVLPGETVADALLHRPLHLTGFAESGDRFRRGTGGGHPESRAGLVAPGSAPGRAARGRRANRYAVE